MGMTTGAVQEGVIEHQKQKPFGITYPLRELTDIQEGFQRGARQQFFGAIMVAMGQPAGAAPQIGTHTAPGIFKSASPPNGQFHGDFRYCHFHFLFHAVTPELTRNPSFLNKDKCICYLGNKTYFLYITRHYTGGYSEISYIHMSHSPYAILRSFSTSRICRILG